MERIIDYPFLHPDIGWVATPEGIVIVQAHQQLRLGDARAAPLIAHLLRRCNGRTPISEILASVPPGARMMTETLIARLVDRAMVTQGDGFDSAYLTDGPGSIAIDLMKTARYAVADWPAAMAAWAGSRIVIEGDAEIADQIFAMLSRCGVTDPQQKTGQAADHLLVIRKAKQTGSIKGRSLPPAQQTLLLWLGHSVLWTLPVRPNEIDGVIPIFEAGDTSALALPAMASAILPSLCVWSLFQAHVLQFAPDPYARLSIAVANRLGPTCQIDSYRLSDIAAAGLPAGAAHGTADTPMPPPRSTHPHFPLALVPAGKGQWAWGMIEAEAQQAAMDMRVAENCANALGLHIDQCLVGSDETALRLHAQALDLAAACMPQLATAALVTDLTALGDVAAVGLARLARLWHDTDPSVRLHMCDPEKCYVASAEMVGHLSVGCGASADAAISAALGDLLCALQTGVTVRRQAGALYRGLHAAFRGQNLPDQAIMQPVWRNGYCDRLPAGYALMVTDQ